MPRNRRNSKQTSILDNNNPNPSSGKPGSTTNKATGSRSAKRYSRKKIYRNRSRNRNRNRKGEAVKGARNQLKNFRQATFLAVAITGFLLTFLAPGEAGYTQAGGVQIQTEDTIDVESESETVADADRISGEDSSETFIVERNISDAAKNEALGTLRKLWNSFYANLPKLLVAIATLFFGWLFTRFLRWLLRKVLGRWEGSSGTITLTMIAVWLFIIGVAISVIAGDIRALIGSIGLIGLALSWSLQVPIESFTGWLLNSFRGYYRVGDRIRVGDVYGDVYRIDFLTTTVWEIGAPFRQGFVQAEQPTGLLVSFPNNEILSGTVVNFTTDFPYVWDELAISIANESDIRFAMQVIENEALNLLKDYMKKPAQDYAEILKHAGLANAVSERPEVFVAIGDSWTDIVVRYLVGARERRKWKSELTLQINDAVSKPEYKNKIISVYPRQQIQMVDASGLPKNDTTE